MDLEHHFVGLNTMIRRIRTPATLPVEGVLFWSSRVLSLLFAGFLSVFAFGALSGGHGLQASILHFVMSAIPALVVLLVLAIAWRWELLGAALFMILALVYVSVSWGRFPISTYMAIAGPPVLVSVLFLAHWWVQLSRGSKGRGGLEPPRRRGGPVRG